MNILTLEKYKLLVGLKNGSFDLLITQLINVIENDILAIRNRDWKRDDNSIPIYPPDILKIAVEMIACKLNTIKGSDSLISEFMVVD